ncbi:hypothetical protein [Phyllobacterium sp. OV277]|uniref:hypothetical protein n=1 Tax=Phyllobacterium sp. OV277 TaxID=1882772 RepID=UPI0008803F61|nr:hypothetical protein [Phyllobacterium sp. OV277]SDP71917.1 hypothetical protein SAMN05443582_108160 [Phyllobacterium sp. OV277]
MIAAGKVVTFGLCVIATIFSGMADAQSASKCTPHEQRVAKAIKEGKALLKEEKFKIWIDKGLRADAPYNKKPYTTYLAWYGRIGSLSAAPDGSHTPEMTKFFETHGFTPSAAYSIIEDYALYGKPNSSVDLDFEVKMNAFHCP